MTFQQLQYLLEVHKAGNFSKAAKNLFVTTSSVSITIGNLEKELGYPLFIRTQKGLTLTANGQKVLDHATHICERYRQLGNIHDESYNSLKIATNQYDPAKSAITRFIAENAHRRDTGITVSATSAETLQKIALFEIDIGIISNYYSRHIPLQNMLESKGLSYRILDLLPIQIIIGRNHPLFHADTIDPKLLEHDIFIDKGGYSRSHYFKGVINIPKENVITVQFHDIRYQLLSQGIGYSFSSKPNNEICDQYGLRCVPLKNECCEIICVTNPTRPLNDLGKQFLKTLDEEIEKRKASRFD